jgi:hypothetical protein
MNKVNTRNNTVAELKAITSRETDELFFISIFFFIIVHKYINSITKRIFFIVIYKYAHLFKFYAIR